MDRAFSFTKKTNDTAVLLLHGLTGSPTELTLLARSLFKAGFDVHCPVLPGHLQSPIKIMEKTWQDWAQASLNEYDALKTKYKRVFVSGLCLGAVLALVLAIERPEVDGIAALAPDMRQDGWAVPWYSFLMPLAMHTPFKYFAIAVERDTFGVKNEDVRKQIHQSFNNNGGSLDFFPVVSLLESRRIGRFVSKNLHKISAPTLVCHSEIDDYVDIGNAKEVIEKISSKDKKLLVLNDSYHLIVFDNERDLVFKTVIEFFERVKSNG